MSAHAEPSSGDECMELLDTIITLIWWTIRSAGRAPLALLRRKPDLAALYGEGLR